MKNKKLAKKIRHSRIRKKISGTSQIPRLTVFRSNLHIYGQAIDDSKGITVASAHDRKLKVGDKNKIEAAFEVGITLAESLKVHKIKKVVFDKGPYKYHGRIKSLAEGVKKGGLVF